MQALFCWVAEWQQTLCCLTFWFSENSITVAFEVAVEGAAMDFVVGLLYWDFLNGRTAGLVAILVFFISIRVGKRSEAENKLYIQRIWDEFNAREKSNEENILWLLVLNTEKYERQATHLRGIYAAAVAILAFLLLNSM
jgi:hypothetical protein